MVQENQRNPLFISMPQAMRQNWEQGPWIRRISPLPPERRSPQKSPGPLSLLMAVMESPRISGKQEPRKDCKIRFYQPRKWPAERLQQRREQEQFARRRRGVNSIKVP